MAKTAMEHGKDVFVEKPLAIKVDDGEELVKIAENKGRILMVGHILNYHPAVIRLKQLIDDGELGKIRYLYSNRLSMGKIRTEENILWSFAPHDISVMLDLIGELPVSVKCQGSAYLNKEIYDVTLSEFTFSGGIAAHIFVSWLHPFKEQRLVVIGSEKMAVFEDTSTEKLKVYPHKIEWNNQIPTAVQAKAEVIDLPVAEPLKSECMEFLNSITTRQKPKTDGREGLRTLKVLDLCEKSIIKN
jgi:UDP-2-acetamido-3-amino-2,3-dideoxy-glucuronate N-acetyltransferase